MKEELKVQEKKKKKERGEKKIQRSNSWPLRQFCEPAIYKDSFKGTSFNRASEAASHRLLPDPPQPTCGLVSHQPARVPNLYRHAVTALAAPRWKI